MLCDAVVCVLVGYLTAEARERELTEQFLAKCRSQDERERALQAARDQVCGTSLNPHPLPSSPAAPPILLLYTPVVDFPHTHSLKTHTAWHTPTHSQPTQLRARAHAHTLTRTLTAHSAPNPPCLLLAIASVVPPCCDFPFFLLQAKAEHLAAVEEQRRIREDMYMRQMEEQARQEAEARAQVRGCVQPPPPPSQRTLHKFFRHAPSHRSAAPYRVHQHTARVDHWQGMSSFWVHGWGWGVLHEGTLADAHTWSRNGVLS